MQLTLTAISINTAFLDCVKDYCCRNSSVWCQHVGADRILMGHGAQHNAMLLFGANM